MSLSPEQEGVRHGHNKKHPGGLLTGEHPGGAFNYRDVILRKLEPAAAALKRSLTPPKFEGSKYISRDFRSRQDEGIGWLIVLLEDQHVSTPFFDGIVEYLFTIIDAKLRRKTDLELSKFGSDMDRVVEALLSQFELAQKNDPNLSRLLEKYRDFSDGFSQPLLEIFRRLVTKKYAQKGTAREALLVFDELMRGSLLKSSPSESQTV